MYIKFYKGFPICYLRGKLETLLFSFILGPELLAREASLSLAEVVKLIDPILIIPVPFIPGPAAVPLGAPGGVHPLHHLPPLPHPHPPVPEAVLPLSPLTEEVIEDGGEHEHVFEGSASRMHESESLELCLGADGTSLVRYSSYRSNDHYQRQRVLQKERAIVSREASPAWEGGLSSAVS